MATLQIRDRIVELRRVRARDLLPNRKNWRRHPKAQMAALKGMLSEVGYAGALLAYETPEGLQLIDGHARAQLTPDMEVPVLVTDLTPAEADKVLATLDPLSAMAQPDQDALLALLEDVSIGDAAVNKMLEALANGENQPMPDWSTGQDLTHGEVAEREVAMAQRFTDNAQRRGDELVKVVCPECGNEFSIRAQDFFQETTS